MFSLGEVVVLLAVGSWAFGPKELPRMGRALGKLTGRATGFIYKARAQLFDFAEKTELTKVQHELQMTMQQLQAIRSELQGGINILDPGPLSRQILGRSGGAGGRGVGGILDRKGSDEHNNTSANLGTQQQQTNLPFAASGVATAAATRDTITKSAAAAGLLPDRSQSRPAASEILADALQEEKVAHQALQFFQQQQFMESNRNSSGCSTGSSAIKKPPRKPRAKKKGGTE
ncbi:hypothetical protein Ndes2526B_g03887 [Nannochloris sp. 'desiccata']